MSRDLLKKLGELPGSVGMEAAGEIKRLRAEVKLLMTPKVPISDLSDDALALRLAPLLWGGRSHPVSRNGMFEVIDAMSAKGWWCRMAGPWSPTAGNLPDNTWNAGFDDVNGTVRDIPQYEAKCFRLERAVCEAALLALESRA